MTETNEPDPPVDPTVDPEIQHFLNALKTSIRLLGFTARDLERKLGYSFGYLSRVFSGSIELKVQHVLDIARALEMGPEELLAFVYPTLRNPPSPAAWELWKRIGGQAPTGTLVIRHQNRAEVSEDDLERALRRTLGRVLSDLARNMDPDQARRQLLQDLSKAQDGEPASESDSDTKKPERQRKAMPAAPREGGRHR